MPHQPEPAAKSSWEITFSGYCVADEGRREVVSALGNGVYVVRAATMDSRQDGRHYPGTYRAGCYNRLPNTILGEHDETESLVNLPNWLLLSIRVAGGAWIRLDDVQVLDYSQHLDLKRGVMRREFLVRDEAGRHTRVSEEHIVSMASPHLCAARIRLTPQDWSGTVEVLSSLDGDIGNFNVARYEDYRHGHLGEMRSEIADDHTVLLKSRTSHSRTAIAIAMQTRISNRDFRAQPVRSGNAEIALHLQTETESENTVIIEKTAALYTDRDGSPDAAADAALRALRQTGDFPQLLDAHQNAWEALWEHCPLDAENTSLALTLRFHVFHILQTISPHTAGLDVGIPARGWHGEAYHGHIFWDELFVLPFLNFRYPKLAKAILMYRYRRLDAARAAASECGCRGAMYPWRSASEGREVTPRHQKNMLSGQWMHDHTYLQRHIGAAIVFNIWQYYLATNDKDFLAEAGAEMMVEIARFWSSIAKPNAKGDRFEIKGVLGPDEFHNAYPGSARAGLDNNAYTNVMAAWSLCRALDVLELLPGECRQTLMERLELSEDELDLWDLISRTMTVPFHGERIISQFEGFAQLPEFHDDLIPPEFADERVDWALHAIGKSPNDYQVTKQADVMTLFYLLSEEDVISLLARLGYRFTHADICRTAQYYLERTTHRSSLSKVVYAGALARLEPQLSWDLYQHALCTDLDPLKGESIAEGIHLGAMGGTIDILQRRYLGLVPRAEGLCINPALPAELGKVDIGFEYGGLMLRMTSEEGLVQIHSRPINSSALTIMHGDQRISLEPGQSLALRGSPWQGRTQTGPEPCN